MFFILQPKSDDLIKQELTPRQLDTLVQMRQAVIPFAQPREKADIFIVAQTIPASQSPTQSAIPAGCRIVNESLIKDKDSICLGDLRWISECKALPLTPMRLDAPNASFTTNFTSGYINILANQAILDIVASKTIEEAGVHFKAFEKQIKDVFHLNVSDPTFDAIQRTVEAPVLQQFSNIYQAQPETIMPPSFITTEDMLRTPGYRETCIKIYDILINPNTHEEYGSLRGILDKNNRYLKAIMPKIKQALAGEAQLSATLEWENNNIRLPSDQVVTALQTATKERKEMIQAHLKQVLSLSCKAYLLSEMIATICLKHQKIASDIFVTSSVQPSFFQPEVTMMISIISMTMLVDDITKYLHVWDNDHQLWHTNFNKTPADIQALLQDNLFSSGQPASPSKPVWKQLIWKQTGKL